MAWIESHQTLREHPKLFRIMEILNTDKPAAVGHLHLLWWWCVDYAPAGVLRCNDAQISRAAEWSGDPQVFVSALVEAGFLERRDGVLTVHDWPEFRLHYDALLLRKEKHLKQLRTRVNRWRVSRRKRSGNAKGNAPVTQKSAPTIPNQPNLTKPNRKEEDAPSAAAKRRTNGQLTDAEFLSALKENPAYKGVDIDRELARMDAWFLTPRARGRKKTRRFVVNWLNRCDSAMAGADLSDQIDREAEAWRKRHEDKTGGA